MKIFEKFQKIDFFRKTNPEPNLSAGKTNPELNLPLSSGKFNPEPNLSAGKTNPELNLEFSFLFPESKNQLFLIGMKNS